MRRKSSELLIGIAHGDILNMRADVLILKYAQHNYGADLQVVKALKVAGVRESACQPAPGQFVLVDSHGSLKAERVLFGGTANLSQFSYPEIRAFTRKSLQYIFNKLPDTTSVIMTLHGVGYGLDETESLEQQLLAIEDAFADRSMPVLLKRITIAERDSGRAERIGKILTQRYGGSGVDVSERGQYWRFPLTTSRSRPRRDAGGRAKAATDGGKAKIFVAMPFASEMRDVYQLGIYQPVRRAEFICERIDEAVFTGPILERIKTGIESALLVIADVTGSNPNVMLEVGYAWGIGRPTLLLMRLGTGKRKGSNIPFDIRGERYVMYEDVVDLQTKLKKEMKALKASLPKNAF